MSMQLRDVLVSEVIPDTKGATSKHTQTTLEAHHQQKMKEFESARESITTLREDLLKIQDQIDSLPQSSMFSDEWRQLNDREEELQRKIKNIQNDDDRLNYFLNVGDMLFQYYDAHESLANGEYQAAKSSTPVRMPSNSVLSYFSSSAKDISHPHPREEAVAPSPKNKGKVPSATEFDSSVGLNRDKLLEKYLAIVEPTAIKSGIMPGSGIEPGWGCCPVCDMEMTFYQNEALLGCPKCGHEEFILIDSEKPSYKDPPREIVYFAYKKINHFNEWLAQFQAKENTDIPKDIIEAVMTELKKERITDPKKLKKEKILQILRKLKLSKMYDHVQQIKNRIQNQMTMLVLSKEQEEKLQFMFKEIQPAFIKYCPPGRSNFLSYPYVLYKLCQLLEMDEYLPCFQLLKSREKLSEQDEVWKKICGEMRWEFIRTI
jgi:hypothetical protein